jgi:hypothetical protein
MANRFLWPPLVLCQINNKHIYNRHIKEEENNLVPPFVGAVLRIIQNLQLVHYIHTTHVNSVLEVHGERHDIFPHRAISSWYRGY